MQDRGSFMVSGTSLPRRARLTAQTAKPDGQTFGDHLYTFWV
jgi:hypothetical protein